MVVASGASDMVGFCLLIHKLLTFCTYFFEGPVLLVYLPAAQ
jgi:hypothetical protein